MNQTKDNPLDRGENQIREDPDPVYSNPGDFQKDFERLSSLAMIGRITPEVIHDINNHLTGILGYAELLSMKRIEDESIKKGLKNISFSAEKCKELLGNIMALSRQEPSQVCFGDVNEIIEKAIALRRCALRHRQIELVLDLGDQIPTLAAGGLNLQKALLNLMFKAEEALENRTGGRIIVIKTTFDSLKNFAVITINTNGLGIPPDGPAQILELPTEETLEPKREFELKEASRWIKEMDGSLIIETKKGKGPVFVVLLPVKGRD